jgi:hypothetical protein
MIQGLSRNILEIFEHVIFGTFCTYSANALNVIGKREKLQNSVLASVECIKK